MFNDNGITVIVTALNILGDQNVDELKGWGIPAVNVTANNISDKLFKVSLVFVSLLLKQVLTYWYSSSRIWWMENIIS